MSINSSSIALDGHTATSGGTSTTLTAGGNTLTQNRAYLDMGNFAERIDIDFTSKDPKVKVDSPSGYSQARRSVFARFPIVLADGSRTVNTLSITLATDVEITDAKLGEMVETGAQLLSATEFQEFWTNGSTS